MPSSIYKIYAFVLFLILPMLASAQEPTKKERPNEFYFSWGYNTEWYTHSDVHISQPSLGNDYTFVNIVGHDHRGWDNQILQKALTIPQYNYRLGYFFNKKKNLSIELNFDHTKFIFADGQQAHLKGTLNGKTTDESIDFSNGKGFYYYLNNGANFFLFNIVKRVNLYTTSSGNFKIDGFGKFGIGPVIPHVENSFFGLHNKPHFQLGGWNTGIEAAIRVTFYKNVYLEYTNKLDYASYSGLRIYEGTASQAFGCYEMILNLGVTFHAGKRIE